MMSLFGDEDHITTSKRKRCRCIEIAAGAASQLQCQGAQDGLHLSVQFAADVQAALDSVHARERRDLQSAVLKDIMAWGCVCCVCVSAHVCGVAMFKI